LINECSEIIYRKSKKFMKKMGNYCEEAEAKTFGKYKVICVNKF